MLRGNQSTLYGSEAMAGVISITTKGGKGSGKILTGETGVEWGSRGTGKTFVNARGETGGVYYSGGASGLTTQGFDISRDGANEQDGNKTGAVNLRVGSDLISDVGILDRLNVELSGRYLKASTEFDGWGSGASVNNDSNHRKIEKSGKVAANVDLFDGVLANSFSAAQSQTRRDLFDADPMYGGKSFYDGEITKYEYQGTLKPLDHNTVVFGADHRRDHMVTSAIDPKSVSSDSVFGNYILGLLDDKLTLSAGVRHDDNETFGGHTTWRTTASYRIPETGTRVHASYGTGFRAPNLSELYESLWGTGNPDLKPEESSGYDIGFEQSVLDDRLTFGSTFFNNRLKNAIVGDPVTWRNENIASARAFGFENNATAELTDEISLSVNHTYTQSRDNSSGRVLPNQPRHTGNARLGYAPGEVPGLNTWVATRTATWSYDSSSTPSYLGGYLVWDFGGSYAVNDWATVYARLENLADKTYETKGGYAAGGRAGFVGMRAKF